MKEMKTYFALFRVWHWLNALAILILLGTVFLRKTFLSYKTNASVLQSELGKIDIDITIDAAKTIGKVIRAPMWEWHYIAGFFLVGLILLRLVLHFTDRKFLIAGEFRKADRKDKIKMISYAILYVLTMVMVLSGLLLYFQKSMGLSKELAMALKECHELIMFFFAVFVPLHIVGVFVAENTDEKGIVSNMIGGKSSK